MEKLQLKQEWWLREKDKENYRGQKINCGMVVELIENGKKIDILLPSSIYHLKVTENFYGFSEESILAGAHIIPNELLEFEIYNRSDWKRKGIRIKKLAHKRYQVEVYTKDWVSDSYSQPKINMKEIIDGKALKRKLENINSVFEPYPFLSMPFGNCFD